ncbi:MAG: MmgE/PrpD family protein [Haloferacaceae archaeon]
MTGPEADAERDGVTGQLAAFVATTGYDDIPDAALDRARTAVRDYLGVAVYGADHEVGDAVGAYVDAHMSGDAATTVNTGTASPPGAALANGAFGHAVDYDDTFESIVIHPTSPTFPAALAVAEHEGATGRETLAAYVLGVDVAFRVGHATYPSHYEKGWHATGTAGSFGAAAAAASVLDLDADATARAFGAVASGSSSLKKNFGTMTKPLHAGHAAEQGVRAALLAAEGFTADPDILDGKLGYGEVMTGEGGYDPDRVVADLAAPDEWGVLDVGYKPYPSGVITHAAMESLRDIVLDHDLAPEDVEHVEVALDDAASEMLHHERPADGLQAKFSIEFCLAAVLRERDPGIHEFTDEYVTDERTRAVIGKVDRAFEPNIFGGEYAGYGAKVTVTTTDGETYRAEMRRAPGSPSNPVSDERLRDKFVENVAARTDEAHAERLANAVESIDETGGLDRLLDEL